MSACLAANDMMPFLGGWDSKSVAQDFSRIAWSMPIIKNTGHDGTLRRTLYFSLPKADSFAEDVSLSQLISLSSLSGVFAKADITPAPTTIQATQPCQVCASPSRPRAAHPGSNGAPRTNRAQLGRSTPREASERVPGQACAV